MECILVSTAAPYEGSVSKSAHIIFPIPCSSTVFAHWPLIAQDTYLGSQSLRFLKTYLLPRSESNPSPGGERTSSWSCIGSHGSQCGAIREQKHYGEVHSHAEGRSSKYDMRVLQNETFVRSCNGHEYASANWESKERVYIKGKARNHRGCETIFHGNGGMSLASLMAQTRGSWKDRLTFTTQDVSRAFKTLGTSSEVIPNFILGSGFYCSLMEIRRAFSSKRNFRIGLNVQFKNDKKGEVLLGSKKLLRNIRDCEPIKYCIMGCWGFSMWFN